MQIPETISADFVDYQTEANNEGEKRNIFTFNSTYGLIDVSIISTSYLNKVFETYGVEDIQGLIEEFKKHVVKLYYSENDDYAGYSLLPPFNKSVYPNRFGMKVKVVNIIETQENVCFELADGTVANRSLCVKRPGTEDWVPNLQKKLRLIKSLHLPVSAMTFDFKDLIGGTITYTIKTLSNNQFMDIQEATLPEKHESESKPIEFSFGN